MRSSKNRPSPIKEFLNYFLMSAVVAQKYLTAQNKLLHFITENLAQNCV